MHTQKLTIVIIGAGKVASHLTKRFRKKGIPIAQIVNRDVNKAKILADTENTGTPYGGLSAILEDADWYLLAVSDGAIAGMADFLRQKTNGKGLFTHVSGATPSTVFKGKNARFGVFYPLQSFSENSKPAWTKIPICVDANSSEDLFFLKKMARKIGKKVFHIDDQQRAALHLSAVFVNNFANHMFSIAAPLLQEQNASMELLHPLMEETVQKAIANPPKSVQTGPALRGDRSTMQRHLEAMEGHPNFAELYRLISEDIQIIK